MPKLKNEDCLHDELHFDYPVEPTMMFKLFGIRHAFKFSSNDDSHIPGHMHRKLPNLAELTTLL